MEIVSKRKDIALNGLSPNKVGSNHKEQPILSPSCLGRMVAAFTIGNRNNFNGNIGYKCGCLAVRAGQLLFANTLTLL